MEVDLVENKKESKLIIDYATVLGRYNLQFRPVEYYYQVGTIDETQGWIIHLSCVWTSIPDLMDGVIPFLIEENVSFKIVQNSEIAVLLNSGSLGHTQLGKIFTIYPRSDERLIQFARGLQDLTGHFKGSKIPTDFWLGGIVYTRYGSFNPILFIDKLGRVDRYIYDAKNDLVRDELNIPFQFPKGIQWPFARIAAPVVDRGSSFLNGQYKIMSVLKTDAKGRVMKAIRLHGLGFQWCIIKEGNYAVCFDEFGRDIYDRLLWQYDLQKELSGQISVPKVYDFFVEGGNSYLVMEYIQGTPLSKVIDDIYSGITWRSLIAKKRILLLDYLIDLIVLIKLFHECGYVHRDINSVNFLVKKNGQIVAIDLELAYALEKRMPNPPFTFGTIGFMSPEQYAVEVPNVKQDIYSIGALMVKFFTNLNPIKFELCNEMVVEHLSFFTGDERISKLVAECTEFDPCDRPSVDVVLSTLKKLRQENVDDYCSGFAIQIKRIPLSKVVSGLIKTLAGPLMRHNDGPWHSSAEQEGGVLANRQAGITYSSGLASGVSGVMYAIAEAALNGYDVSGILSAYSTGLSFLDGNFVGSMPNVIPGLYHGAAGVGLSLSMGMEAGLISSNYCDTVRRCFEVPNDELDMEHGIAGKSLAVLECYSLLSQRRSLGHSFLKEKIEDGIQTLLSSQQKDGSWISVRDERGRPIKFTGLSQGVSGIVLCLLRYFEMSQDMSVKASIERALNWLSTKQKSDVKGKYWRINDRDRLSDPWLNVGVTGIAYCFTIAYRVLGLTTYKRTAEAALSMNPGDLVAYNFSLGYGLSGLGITYLDAWSIFKNPEWKNRADFIIDVLKHTMRGNVESPSYWITEELKNPTAALLTGNCGILKFLMKYYSTTLKNEI